MEIKESCPISSVSRFRSKGESGKRSLVALLLFSMFMILTAGTCGAQPGWRMAWAPPIAPAQATEILGLGGGGAMLLGLTTSETEATPEIQEMARALNHDPKRIYEFVHNHIEFVPTFGSVNGATATLLARRGNDFDQASLLIALLRVSGHEANYSLVDAAYPDFFLSDWLGVDSEQVVEILALGGIPVDRDPMFYYVVYVRRLMVKTNIGGIDYLLDPAFKFHSSTAKINIGQAMGYDRQSLLSTGAAGAETGANYVKNMNEPNVRSALQGWSTALSNYLKQHHPNDSLREIIGGRRILAETFDDGQTEPFWAFYLFPQAEWTEIPDSYRLKIRVQHQGIDRTLGAYEIAGKRVTILYTGQNYLPELRVDGALIATGNATSPGSVNDLVISVDHPYPALNNSYADEQATFKLKSGHAYAIAHDFETVSRDLIKSHTTALTKTRLSGETEPEPLLGESLCLIGLNWYSDLMLTKRLLAYLFDVVPVSHHALGIVAQEEGYYIDVKLSYFTSTSMHDFMDNSESWFIATMNVGSAFEHGVLEQLQGPDKPSTSTIKLLGMSNAGGKKTFYADSSNFAAIRSQLLNYTQAQLDLLQSAVNSGSKLILPEDAHIDLNQWRGLGYIDYFNDASSSQIGMIISGGYYGGYGATPKPIDQQYIQDITNINFAYDWSKVTSPAPRSQDPIDMGFGSFVHDHTDLSLGRNEPQGLRFARSYNSANIYQKGALGSGWTHNYDIYHQSHSHSDPVLGNRLPVDAASAIVAFYAIGDLMGGEKNLQDWVVSVLAAKWAVDQLLDNAVSVHVGNKILEYIKLADNSYNPPPGITAQLINNGDDTFRLEERIGRTIWFDSQSRISSSEDADGNFMTFEYSGDKLQTVMDFFNRALTFSYSGDLIQSVSDSAGRMVSYGYVNDELRTYTDPENKIWTYGYDPEHRMTTLTNPLQITTATNEYDQLGRVKTQTVPRQTGNAVYNLYFSGFRNMEEDPQGNKTIYYFDEKSRNTGIENPLGRKTTMDYDAQDHLVKVIDPRMNITSYGYDGSNNLSGVTNALGRKTEYLYDAQFRRTDVIDPLGNRSHTDYDSEHHPIKSTIFPGGGKEIYNWFTYYGEGLLNTSRDGRGNVTTIGYDQYGNPQLTQVGYDQPPILYTYDSIGRMESLMDEADSITSFEYDDRSLLQRKIDPLGGLTELTYYDDGALHTVTDRNNHTTSFTYTQPGKVDAITYQDQSTVGFTYDVRDNLTVMSDSLGQTSYTYDPANRLSSQTDPHGFTVGYSYDAAGNLSGVTYPGNRVIRYTYDALNRLQTVSIDWLSQTATYHYDDAGRMDLLDQFNGTVVTQAFDDANRMTSLVNRTSGDAAIATYQYTLDDNGNIVYAAQEAPIAPIASAMTIDHTYNAMRNRLLTAGVTSFTYDNEGQLSTKGGSPYTFDGAHRLVNAGGTNQYFYDGSGNRLKAVRSDETRKYVYDAAGRLLAEADASNNILRYYIHGLGLMAMVTASGELYCYHFDSIGNTMAMTDNSQAMVNRYAYTPFGIIANQMETLTFPQPFKFVGRWGVMTEPNGFYYMKARYYDPEVGRFISEDPIGFDGGDTNLYLYASNNPIMFMDPNGQWITTAIGIINGGISGALAGAMNGDLTSAVIGGVVGAAVGGLAGTFIPGAGGAAAAAVVNQVLSGSIGGAFGGLTGGAISAYRSGDDLLGSAGRGALSGAISGAISGLTSGVAGVAVRAGVGTAPGANAAQALYSGIIGTQTEAIYGTAGYLMSGK